MVHVKEKAISIAQNIFSGPAHMFKFYWRAYGGIRGIFCSLYFYTALLICFLLYPTWSKVGWWSDPIGLLPNIIGFTLGGYAIFTAFGDEKFKSLIAGQNEDGKTSPFINANATFVHFILLQIIAVILAIIGKSWFSKLLFTSLDNTPAFYIFSFISYFIFTYALLSTIAATMAILRLAEWYDIFVKAQKENHNDDGV